MKKLFSLLAAILCAAMLSSSVFAADANAYSIYQKCVKKMKSVSSMEISMVQRFTMSSKGYDISTKQNNTIKILFAPENKLHMEVKSLAPNSDEPTYYYYRNGYYYRDMGFYKARVKMKADDVLYSTVNLDMNLVKSDFKDAKVEKSSDGTKITYVTKLADSKDESIRQLVKYLETADSSMKMSISDMTTVFTVGNDGMLKSSSVSFVISVSSDGDTYKMRQTQTSTVKSVNTVMKIDFPKDLNTYTTIS